MADSSRHNLHFVAETTYGTTPATPALTKFRHKSCTLALAKSSVVSEEIRADRQIQDFRHGTKQVGGDIGAELCFAAFDAILEAALCGTWAVAALVTYAAATISASSTDNSLNDSGAGFPALSTGDTISIAGFITNPGNNGTATVVTRTASKIVISGVTLTTEAASESITITKTGPKTVLKAGTTRRSFSVLRDFSDIVTGRYHLFAGVEVTKVDLKVTPGAIVELGFGVVGQSMIAGDTAPAGATYPAADTHAPMDAFSGAVLVDEVPNGVATELAITLENGILPRFVVGSAETIEPSIGRSNLTGQATFYFENATMINQFLNEDEVPIKFTLGDGSAGNTYEILLPRVKFTGASRT